MLRNQMFNLKKKSKLACTLISFMTNFYRNLIEKNENIALQIYIHTHTHTHIHIYIYIYIYI